jgi:outer membrane protein assembly factor BamE (lipoprotein component of BamABCDE complex)
MVSKRFTFLVVLSLVLFMAFSACSNKQVRYLASDVSLISPEITTKQEVLAILGQPDEQYVESTGEEVWVYYDAKESLMSDTPYIGEKIGDEQFEMVKVTFAGDIVRTSEYRSMSEEEYKQNGQTE